MEVRIRAALMALSVSLLSSCGGGSSGSSDSNGIWRGTYAPDGSNPVSLVAMAHGNLLFFYDPTGLTYVIKQYPGSGDISQNGQVFPAHGFVFDEPGLDPNALGVGVKGTISTSQITGSLTVNGDVMQVVLNAYRPFSGDPSVVPGKWSGEFLSPYTQGTDITSHSPISLTVAADGTISGSDDSGCTISGTITPEMNGDNMFEVSLDEHGNGYPQPCEGTFTGLAYESDSDEQDIFGHASGTYYYIVGWGANGESAISTEFRVD